MKHQRPLLVFSAIVTLFTLLLMAIGWDSPPAAARPSACQVISAPGELADTELINFDDLANGYNIGTYYQGAHGVIFEDSRQARVNAMAYGGAQSSPNVAINEAIGTSELDTPLTITFVEPLSGVGFYLGNGAVELVNAQVIAFDDANNEICLTDSGIVPTDNDLFIGFFDEQKRISRLTIDYASDTAPENLDNLVISRAGEVLPPSSTPTFTPTVTATATSTPTVTPTPTNTPSPYDLVARGVEVTQGLQDMNNSIPLIRGKRTYVRFYVSASSFKFLPAGAQLYVQCIGCPFGSTAIKVAPINGVQGKLIVPKAPSRSSVNQSFLFEIPSYYTLGDKLIVSAEVDPAKVIVETDESNNKSFSGELLMQDVRPIRLILHSMTYLNNGVHTPRLFDDIANGLRWMKQAYPTAQVQFELHNQFYWGSIITDGKPSPTMLDPSCNTFNYLNAINSGGANLTAELVSTTRRYSMIDEGGGWMRGCASWGASSGPTGVPRIHPNLGDIRWDIDGSYGDWYMGHEIGHSYGRPHTACSSEAGAVTQYPGGVISPNASGPNALFGLERLLNGSFRTYQPNSADFMTYCPNQWPSDITYKALMSRFNQLLPPYPQNVLSSSGQDLLMVAGTISPAGSSADLYPVFLIPDVPGPNPRVPGPYAIVLRGSGGDELARYPFTPDETETEGQAASLNVLEFVPAVPGMARLELRGPGDELLAAVQPGAGIPVVTVETPNGGDMEDGESLLVRWNASDPDGDPLKYQVQYSADGGSSWSLAAFSEGVTEVTIDKSNTPAGEQALIRVLASDGLHTGSDTSDAVFTIPNQKPQVQILSPVNGQVVAVEQTLALEGWAYDNDSGSMDGEAVRWLSDKDGELGTGTAISVSGLSVGTHLITLRADDGEGGIAQDQVTVEVVGDLADLPLPENELVVEPGFLQFRPGIDPAQQSLILSNLNGGQVLGWAASTDAAWLTLSNKNGQTPDQLTVMIDQDKASWADRETVITFTRQGSSEQVQVFVQMIPARSDLFLPVTVADP